MNSQKYRTLWHLQRPPRTRMPRPKRTQKRPYVEPFSLPPTLIFCTTLRLSGRYGSDRKAAAFEKCGADRSAIANYSRETGREGEKTTRKNVRTRARKRRRLKSQPDQTPELRRSGWCDSASGRLQDASCTGVQNGG